MATIKSHTDLPQSKKLAEILPLESADMHYATWTILDNEFIVSPNQGSKIEDLQEEYGSQIIPCWSLTALLSVLPHPSLHKTFSGWRCDSYNKEGTSSILGESSDNPVDACYEMILKLHELNLL